MSLEVDVIIHNSRWHDVLPGGEALAKAVVEMVLSRPEFSHGKEALMEVSVVMADDTFIQELNAVYRKKDKPTNVLSFPSMELIPGGPWPVEEGEVFLLGDVILALETIQREAIEQHKIFKNHFCHLLIHGILHLLGYDHIKKADATVMETLEVAILQSIGITNPYVTRHVNNYHT